MKQITLIFLLCLLALTACSNTDPVIFYAPTDSLDLQVMAEEYPLQYIEWEGSVHGRAYLDGDQNAPACLDCHDDPAGGEIQTVAFQLDIPNRCGRCHADKDIMTEYDISTSVYQTYLADYHGTTIDYYRDVDADEYRYEAVCSDCHGSHEVYSVEDELSPVHANNLTATCQNCHPSAPEGFSAAFGHYRSSRSPASRAESPVIFWVKLFYQALLPVVLGGMVLYVSLDIRHRVNTNRNELK